jgi:hypothetical protein
MTNLKDLSSSQLRRIIDIKEQIETLQREIEGIASGTPVSSQVIEDTPTRRGMSAAGRARVAAAAKVRWARIRAAKGAAAPKRRTMSAAAKAKIAASARARWAKAKAAGKSSL